MTIREEIRDRVIANIAKACPEMLNADIVKLADKILQGEASQGVVIKVDRELPYMDDTDWTWKVNSGDYHITDLKKGAAHQLKIILKAGYVAVEPLI